MALATVLAALLIYPGELSWLSPKGTRWLYDRGAKNYESKWLRHDYTPYDALITQTAQSIEATNSSPKVLDLCCGTGRATLLVTRLLGSQANYTAVDFSAEMLASLKARIGNSVHARELEIDVIQADVQNWLEGKSTGYDLLLLMEAGEFLPNFKAVVSGIGTACNSGGALVMTRPAGFWSLFFPGRAQTRSQLSAQLLQAGFSDVQFSPWRKRYELVHARKD